MAEFFSGAKGVRITGGFHTEDIKGDYIDNGYTTIDERQSSRESYDQRRTTGVSNGHSTFSTGANKRGSRDGITNRRNERRMTGQEPRHEDSPQHDSDDDEGERFSPSHSRRETPSRMPSFFQGAEDVHINGGFTSKTIGGDSHITGTKHIDRRTTREADYMQKGATGVSNGNSQFSAPIDIAGGGRVRSSSIGQNSGYSDSDDTSGSEASYHTRRHIDQRGSVGVANGNSTFRGQVNITYGDQGNDHRFLHPYDTPASAAHRPSQYVLDQRQSVGLANDAAMFDGSVNVNYGRQGEGYPGGLGGGRRPPQDPHVYHPEGPYYAQHPGQTYAPPIDVFQEYNSNRHIPRISVVPGSPTQGHASDPYRAYGHYAQQRDPPYQGHLGYQTPSGPPRHYENNQHHRDWSHYGQSPQNLGYPMSPPPRQAYPSQHARPYSPQPPPPYGSTSHARQSPVNPWDAPNQPTVQRSGGSDSSMNGLEDQMGGMMLDPRPSRSQSRPGEKTYAYCN